ncbi:hypothetical protein [Streptomyces sp. NPDC014793]|uniref:hypothetical protein n=1 Tax=Streptomyces sp. NPDC014793 TaxID=3364914 RepID=UPI0036F55359
MPEPTPMPPRQDPGAADVQSLVALGVEEPPPIPSTDPFLEPVYPDLPGGYVGDEPA